MKNPVTLTDIDAALAATAWDTPIETVNPLDPDVLLYGADPTSGIVSLDVRNDGTVTVWRRISKDEVVCERGTFEPWFLAASLDVLAPLDDRLVRLERRQPVPADKLAGYEELAGASYYQAARTRCVIMGVRGIRLWKCWSSGRRERGRSNASSCLVE